MSLWVPHIASDRRSTFRHSCIRQAEARPALHLPARGRKAKAWRSFSSIESWWRSVTQESAAQCGAHADATKLWTTCIQWWSPPQSSTVSRLLCIVRVMPLGIVAAAGFMHVSLQNLQCCRPHCAMPSIRWLTSAHLPEQREIRS